MDLLSTIVISIGCGFVVSVAIIELLDDLKEKLKTYDENKEDDEK